MLKADSWPCAQRLILVEFEGSYVLPVMEPSFPQVQRKVLTAYSSPEFARVPPGLKVMVGTSLFPGGLAEHGPPKMAVPEGHVPSGPGIWFCFYFASEAKQIVLFCFDWPY